eukprot:6182543-Pleurochrysis_carterae.AAC.2
MVGTVSSKSLVSSRAINGMQSQFAHRARAKTRASLAQSACGETATAYVLMYAHATRTPVLIY